MTTNTREIVEQTGVETPMRDHVASFWQLLAKQTRVRILVDVFHPEGFGGLGWESAHSFPDDLAKALVADRQEAATLIEWLTERSEKDAAVLKEAELQIEYLHEKFLTTSTGVAVLSRIRAALEGWEGEDEAVAKALERRANKGRGTSLEEMRTRYTSPPQAPAGDRLREIRERLAASWPMSGHESDPEKAIIEAINLLDELVQPTPSPRDAALEEAAEKAAQAVRYYLKHQEFSQDDDRKYQSAVEDTCANLEEIVAAAISALRTTPEIPK